MRILLVCMYRYPEGDAGSVRVHAFAKLFLNLGYEVTVAGLGDSTGFMMKEYEGVRYTSLRDPADRLYKKVLNRLLYSNRLKQRMASEAYDCVFTEEISIRAMGYLKKYAGRKGIPLLFDCVEWYSKEQFPLSGFDIRYRKKDWVNRRWADSNTRVIAISTYLEKHFRAKGCAVVRIPVIMDVSGIPCRKKKLDKLILLYAGSPGRKDYLNVILKGLAGLEKKELEKIELRILGIKEDQMEKKCGVEKKILNRLRQTVRFFGRVPRQKVMEQMEEADFTVLIRSENQRYAKAGFPTKVVESLAGGTPVICNLTSDLGLYIRDGENGIIAGGESAGDFSGAVRRILELDGGRLAEMKENARKSAEDFFDYKKYISIAEEFLNENSTDQYYL